MCFKKKYTEEEVTTIVNNALEEQRLQLEKEAEMEDIHSKLEDFEERISILENKKAGF